MCFHFYYPSQNKISLSYTNHINNESHYGIELLSTIEGN